MTEFKHKAPDYLYADAHVRPLGSAVAALAGARPYEATPTRRSRTQTPAEALPNTTGDTPTTEMAPQSAQVDPTLAMYGTSLEQPSSEEVRGWASGHL